MMNYNHYNISPSFPLIIILPVAQELGPSVQSGIFWSLVVSKAQDMASRNDHQLSMLWKSTRTWLLWWLRSPNAPQFEIPVDDLPLVPGHSNRREFLAKCLANENEYENWHEIKWPSTSSRVVCPWPWSWWSWCSVALVLSAASLLLLGNGSAMQGEVIILISARSPKKSYNSSTGERA